MNYLSDNLFGLSRYSIHAFVPDRQLLRNSLFIGNNGRSFKDWSREDHADSFKIMQRVAEAWKRANFTNQYLIYGEIHSNTFSWEIVPYQRCFTIIGRVVQQIQVLWRVVFGGVVVSEESKKEQHKEMERLLREPTSSFESPVLRASFPDPFCQKEVIDRQWVMTGKKINVLFNYAPIGFGGERLHFLVVPKTHRTTFTDVTEEEYCESLDLTQKVVTHFNETRKNIKKVYLMSKTGQDAGQTVQHWHLHVIITTNEAQDFWGKMTVLKNILFGSSPMNKDTFKQSVAGFRRKLAT